MSSQQQSQGQLVSRTYSFLFCRELLVLRWAIWLCREQFVIEGTVMDNCIYQRTNNNQYQSHEQFTYLVAWSLNLFLIKTTRVDPGLQEGGAPWKEATNRESVPSKGKGRAGHKVAFIGREALHNISLCEARFQPPPPHLQIIITQSF